MTERAFLIWGAAACALLGGCAAEVVDGPHADDEEVALTAEALGNTVTVASGLGPVLVSWNGLPELHHALER